jgi:Rrf2 family nitric oxide-sensitive transcriptional repressor
MRLTKQTSHAIRILTQCTRVGDRRVKVAELASSLGITPQNAFKIVHILVKAGFLKAVRGRAGGVTLSRPATEIIVGDVVRATEVTHVEVDDGDVTASAAAPLPINRILDEALEAFIAILDQHTLADMARVTPPDPSRRPGGKPRRTGPSPIGAGSPVNAGARTSKSTS